MNDQPDKQKGMSSNELTPDALNEEEFQAYLDGDSTLSKTYRDMAAPEPPQALDRAILDQARAAVKPQRKGWLELDLEFWRAWARPISTVVIMGAALAVVLQVIETTTVTPTELLTMETLNGHGSMQKQTTSPAPAIPDHTIATDRSAKESTAASRSPARIAADTPDPGFSETQLARQRAEADSTGARYRMSAPSQSDDTDHVTGKLAIAEERRLQAEKPAGDDFAPAAAVGRGQNTAIDLLPADSALEAWNAGARPAADVWLAGIEAWHGDYQSASAELKKVEQLYPDEAEIYLQRRNATAPAAAVSSDAAGNGTVALQEAPQDQQEIFAAESLPALPDPNIWAAGINKLYGDDNEKAAAERAKLQQVYPDFVW
jgi:hypothetical protein